MIQRVVGTESEEYTVGVFGLGNGEAIGPIVMKRRLSSNGFTQQAQVVSDSAIEEASLALTRHFKPIGATNYQFRKEGHQALLLEINPRFSSSNSLRTAFGFNEALMTIDFFILNKTPAIPAIKLGMAYRYNEDFVSHDRSH
jgi:carbamoyl-phosphate synthase large subunit